MPKVVRPELEAHRPDFLPARMLWVRVAVAVAILVEVQRLSWAMSTMTSMFIRAVEEAARWVRKAFSKTCRVLPGNIRWDRKCPISPRHSLGMKSSPRAAQVLQIDRRAPRVTPL